MSKSREELESELQSSFWQLIEQWIPNSDHLTGLVEELTSAIMEEFELQDCDTSENESLEEFFADMDQFEGVYND